MARIHPYDTRTPRRRKLIKRCHLLRDPEPCVFSFLHRYLYAAFYMLRCQKGSCKAEKVMGLYFHIQKKIVEPPNTMLVKMSSSIGRNRKRDQTPPILGSQIIVPLSLLVRLNSKTKRKMKEADPQILSIHPKRGDKCVG